MNKATQSSYSNVVNQQGAIALLSATIAFLVSNKIPRKLIVASTRQHRGQLSSSGQVRQYRQLIRAYEDMGTVMSTWYSSPRYLDKDSQPLPLTPRQGARSIASLVRASRVKTSVTMAIGLMRQSPSIRIDASGNYTALKRVFVLPNIEIPRAALVIERYLDTLRKNSAARRTGTALLLERNCHVPEIDRSRISPILRDIRRRGTAFMDSVDGDIEAHRMQRTGRKGAAELGVLVFAWTRPSRIRRLKLNT